MAEFGRFIAKEAHCLACGRRPESVERYPDVSELTYRLVFFCHGARQVVTLDERVIRARDYAPLRAAIDAVRGLFPDHAHPDVKELLAYNRNATPGRTP